MIDKRSAQPPFGGDNVETQPFDAAEAASTFLRGNAGDVLDISDEEQDGTVLARSLAQDFGQVGDSQEGASQGAPIWSYIIEVYRYHRIILYHYTWHMSYII